MQQGRANHPDHLDLKIAFHKNKQTMQNLEDGRISAIFNEQEVAVVPTVVVVSFCEPTGRKIAPTVCNNMISNLIHKNKSGSVTVTIILINYKRKRS